MKVSNPNRIQPDERRARSACQSSTEQSPFEQLSMARSRSDVTADNSGRGTPSAVTKACFVNRKTFDLLRGLPQKAEEIYSEYYNNIDTLNGNNADRFGPDILRKYNIAKPLVDPVPSVHFGITGNVDERSKKKTALVLTLATLAVKSLIDLEKIRDSRNRGVEGFPDAFPITGEISVPWGIILNNDLIDPPRPLHHL